MSKKVIFCANSILGFVQFRLDVAVAFQNAGWNVKIILPSPTVDEPMSSQLEDRFDVLLLNFNRDGTNPFKDLKLCLEFRQIFKRERPDIVFNYTIKPNIYGCLAAKSLGIPCVDMVAGLGYMFDGDSVLKRLGRSLYRVGLRRADRVFALNSDNAETLVEGKYVNPDNLILLSGGEGVNIDRYPCKPMAFDSTGIRFLMVARVLYDKGYSEFVGAARIVKQRFADTEFELLGPLDHTSPMRVPEEEIDKDVASGTIRYLGVTDRVQDYVLRENTVVVLPSKYFEGLNRSLMEACSMGRPIITTNIPGCREIVEDGVNGFLVSSGDTQALAGAMMRFIEMRKEEKCSMARASRERAERIFDVRQCLREYGNVVRDLTGADLGPDFD